MKLQKIFSHYPSSCQSPNRLPINFDKKKSEMKKKGKKRLRQQEPYATKHDAKQVKNVRKKVRQYIRSTLALSEDMDESLQRFLK